MGQLSPRGTLLCAQDNKAIVPEDLLCMSCSEDCQPFYALLASKALRPLLPLPEEPLQEPQHSETAPGGTTGACSESSSSRGRAGGPGPVPAAPPGPPLPVPANRQLMVWVGTRFCRATRPRCTALVPQIRACGPRRISVILDLGFCVRPVPLPQASEPSVKSTVLLTVQVAGW